MPFRHDAFGPGIEHSNLALHANCCETARGLENLVAQLRPHPPLSRMYAKCLHLLSRSQHSKCPLKGPNSPTSPLPWQTASRLDFSHHRSNLGGRRLLKPKRHIRTQGRVRQLLPNTTMGFLWGFLASSQTSNSHCLSLSLTVSHCLTVSLSLSPFVQRTGTLLSILPLPE